MSKTNDQLRPQDTKASTVTVSVYLLTIALTFFATAVFVTIANWFIYTNIDGEARAAVHQDIQLVSKDLDR